MDQQPEQTGCLTVILRFFGIDLAKAKPASALPYRQRDDFLSAAERSFFGVLQLAIGSRAVLLAKVRVADLLYVPRGEGRQGFQNKIDRKHVDFLLCDPQTLRPLAAIELDDSSHERQERRERDQFLDDAFAMAGLPLLHFPAQRQYDPRALSSELEPYLLNKQPQQGAIVSPGIAAPRSSENTPPACPKCGAPMVVRTANKGSRQGQKFYACPNYPQCQSTLAIESS